LVANLPTQARRFKLRISANLLQNFGDDFLDRTGRCAAQAGAALGPMLIPGRKDTVGLLARAVFACTVVVHKRAVSLTRNLARPDFVSTLILR